VGVRVRRRRTRNYDEIKTYLFITF
jgi:hypothetical protein